jgi:hypothetical protein
MQTRSMPHGKLGAINTGKAFYMRNQGLTTILLTAFRGHKWVDPM